MRARVSTVPAAAVTAVAALLGLTACSGGGDPSPRGRDGSTATAPGQIKGTLSDLVGLDLATAGTKITAAGFDEPRAVDASGQDRAPSPPEEWKVCVQSVEPGEHPTGISIELQVLKLGEDCSKPPTATKDPTTTPSPTRSPSPTRAPATTKGPASPSPQRTTRPGWPGGDWVFYRNCADARRQGADLPIRRGEPGYGLHLDRDGDGVACD